MYDSGKIIIGLVIFVLLVTFPIWYNHGNAGQTPKPELPRQGKECVRPAAEMRASHMQLLNQWRDEVIRTGDRGSFVIEGKKYQKSLQNTCMQCHSSKKKFCDTCHAYTSVTPYCWDCHVVPVE
ncbi:MAG: cytochrome C [Desulfobulbaceae bacterium A2]|nr:MAG: cytochrome C [Desulfobulbaceae bacterium A2]